MKAHRSRDCVGICFMAVIKHEMRCVRPGGVSGSVCRNEQDELNLQRPASCQGHLGGGPLVWRNLHWWLYLHLLAWWKRHGILLHLSIAVGLGGVGADGGGMSLVAGGCFAASMNKRYSSYSRLASSRLSVTWSGSWVGISLLW